MEYVSVCLNSKEGSSFENFYKNETIFENCFKIEISFEILFKLGQVLKSSKILKLAFEVQIFGRKYILEINSKKNLGLGMWT